MNARRVSLGSDAEEDLNLDLLSSAAIGDATPEPPFMAGTRSLMLAVLEDAVRCFLDGGKYVSEEARNWIYSNRRSWPFAFVVVCETLRLEPSAVRRMLAQMKAKKVHSRQTIPRARKNVRRPGRVCTRKSARAAFAG